MIEGGQFRKETILPNGTVVGAYSWKDGGGRIRLYTYMADKRGYRVMQHDLRRKNDNNLISDNSIDDADLDQDIDVARSHRNSKRLRLRRKVLVKRNKSGRSNFPPNGVRVKKLGAAAEIIPYQPTLLLRLYICSECDNVQTKTFYKISEINILAEKER